MEQQKKEEHVHRVFEKISDNLSASISGNETFDAAEE